MLGLAVVVIALVVATRRGGRAVGSVYRSRRDSWTAANPDAGGITGFAAALGHMASTVWYGPRAFRDGFRTGWPGGWQLGRAWADQYRPNRPQPSGNTADNRPTPDPDPDFPPQPAAGQPGPPAAPTATPLHRPSPTGRPNLRAVPASPASQGDDDMAINTATGGEVTSPETLAAEASAIEIESAAELQDALADAARAREDLKRIERMVASVKAALIKLPASDVAMIERLAEPAQQRLAAANQRAQAAEHRLALARAVAVMAAKHQQFVGTAAGGFYGNR